MKLFIKESVADTLYCVAGFDDENFQSYNGGNLILVAFSNLGDAEDFESTINEHIKNSDWDDDVDPEYFDVSDGYEDWDYLEDLRCVGCYTVPVQDAVNAQNYDPNVIPGKEVVILNQNDIYDGKLISFLNIPDKFYR